VFFVSRNQKKFWGNADFILGVEKGPCVFGPQNWGIVLNFELGRFIFRLDGKGGLRVRLDARWRF